MVGFWILWVSEDLFLVEFHHQWHTGKWNLLRSQAIGKQTYMYMYMYVTPFFSFFFLSIREIIQKQSHYMYIGSLNEIEINKTLVKSVIFLMRQNSQTEI